VTKGEKKIAAAEPQPTEKGKPQPTEKGKPQPTEKGKPLPTEKGAAQPTEKGGVKKGMLVLVLLPEATGEEDENGENLKTSYEHEEGAYPLHSNT